MAEFVDVLREWSSVIVRDLTYDEAAKRAQTCFCFKWIPTTVGKYDDVMKAKSSGHCDGSIRGLLSIPMLAPFIEREAAEAIDLNNG